MERLDEAIFLALNFDGGSAIDHTMFIVSGKLTWLPLYLLIVLPADQADALLADIQALGVPSAIVGEMMEPGQKEIIVTTLYK